MMRDDFNRFRKICKTELSNKYFYQSHNTDVDYQYLFDKIRIRNTIFKETYLSNHNINHGLYIDIFPVDKIPNSK
ncbi:LicD family protein, partial [Limosilactobacillus reuteri]